jgi:hypothetical protein
LVVSLQRTFLFDDFFNADGHGVIFYYLCV